MRGRIFRVVVGTVSAAFLCGCSSHYYAAYWADCHAGNTDVRVRTQNIATEISQAVGTQPTLSEQTVDLLQFYVNVPVAFGGGQSGGDSAGPWLGQIKVSGYAGKVTVSFMRKGEGEDEVTARMKRIVEESLRENDCADWKLNQQATPFELK